PGDGRPRARAPRRAAGARVTTLRRPGARPFPGFRGFRKIPRPLGKSRKVSEILGKIPSGRAPPRRTLGGRRRSLGRDPPARGFPDPPLVRRSPLRGARPRDPSPFFRVSRVSEDVGKIPSGPAPPRRTLA